jgi:hypothetical protein
MVVSSWRQGLSSLGKPCSSWCTMMEKVQKETSAKRAQLRVASWLKCVVYLQLASASVCLLLLSRSLCQASSNTDSTRRLH